MVLFWMYIVYRTSWRCFRFNVDLTLECRKKSHGTKSGSCDGWSNTSSSHANKGHGQRDLFSNTAGVAFKRESMDISPVEISSYIFWRLGYLWVRHMNNFNNDWKYCTTFVKIKSKTRTRLFHSSLQTPEFGNFFHGSFNVKWALLLTIILRVKPALGLTTSWRKFCLMLTCDLNTIL